MLNRTIVPEFRGIDELALIRPQEIQLDNGCKIFSFNSGELELVRLEWIFSNLNFNPAKPLCFPKAPARVPQHKLQMK